jgi:hypothetical protein
VEEFEEKLRDIAGKDWAFYGCRTMLFGQRASYSVVFDLGSRVKITDLQGTFGLKGDVALLELASRPRSGEWAKQFIKQEVEAMLEEHCLLSRDCWFGDLDIRSGVRVETQEEDAQLAERAPLGSLEMCVCAAREQAEGLHYGRDIMEKAMRLQQERVTLAEMELVASFTGTGGCAGTTRGTQFVTFVDTFESPVAFEEEYYSGSVSDIDWVGEALRVGKEDDVEEMT